MTTGIQQLAELVEWETKVKNAHLREKETKATLNQCVDDTKAARKIWEEAVEATGRAIDAADEEFPLLDGQKKAVPEITLIDDGDDWRDVLVVEVEGFSPTIVKHLTNASLYTLGNLARFGHDYAFTDIKGIGPGASQVMEDALPKGWEMQ